MRSKGLGIVFIEENGGGAGVRLGKRRDEAVELLVLR
jgi:hypothetical protein